MADDNFNVQEDCGEMAAEPLTHLLTPHTSQDEEDPEPPGQGAVSECLVEHTLPPPTPSST